jgi:signal transduction histidine kinase
MKRRFSTETLLPTKLFTPQVFFVSLFWMAILHFLDWENNNGLSQPAQRSVALVAAHLVAFALPALVYLGLRLRLTNDRLTIALIIAIVAAAPLRGLSFFYMLELINGEDPAGMVMRITGSLTNMTFAVVVAWVGFSAAENHNQRKRRLIEDRQQLLAMRHQARSQLASLDHDSAEQIRSTLLDAIKVKHADQAKGVAFALRGLIEDVVRPLSRYFEQQSDRWVPPNPPESLLRIDWRAVFSNVLQPRNIQPVLLVALMYWISAVNTVMNRGVLIAFISALHFAASIPMFFLIKRFAIRIAVKRGVRIQAAIFFAALYIPGQILGLTAWFYTRFQEPQFFYATMGPIFILIGGTLMAFAQSLINESAAMEDALTRAASDLRWSLARAREQHRQQRRTLAHALHGEVQAAVASAILRLEMTGKDIERNPETVSEIVESLQSTIENVNFLTSANETVDVVIDRISATWEGIARVVAHLDYPVTDRLVKDPICAVALNDVLTELTYNSIKHGSASEVAIDLGNSDDRVLTVLVVDNGDGLSGNQHRGLGSALLDDCAISWERSRVDGNTQTEVLLPLA